MSGLEPDGDECAHKFAQQSREDIDVQADGFVVPAELTVYRCDLCGVEERHVIDRAISALLHRDGMEKGE